MAVTDAELEAKQAAPVWCVSAGRGEGERESWRGGIGDTGRESRRGGGTVERRGRGRRAGVQRQRETQARATRDSGVVRIWQRTKVNAAQVSAAATAITALSLISLIPSRERCGTSDWGDNMINSHRPPSGSTSKSVMCQSSVAAESSVGKGWFGRRAPGKASLTRVQSRFDALS